MAGICAEGIRSQKRSKNKDIKIVTRATPLVWLFREDNGDVLHDKDKCMMNWVDPFEEKREAEKQGSRAVEK